jgi:hypothetical protein
MLLPTLIAIPLVLIWLLTLVDVVRRHDLRASSKALWILATLVVPVIGPIVYFVVRPEGATEAGSPPPSESPSTRHGPA